MPISAIGKRSGATLPFSLSLTESKGFTLLELMLVIMIMAMAVAFVAPNLFRPPRADLDDSARLMVRILSLAGEEAAVRGVPIRCNFSKHFYAFELAGKKGVWQPLNDQPFGKHKLPEGVSVSQVKLAEGVQIYFSGRTGPARNSRDREPGSNASQNSPSHGSKRGLGSVVFQPDGMLDASDIRLHADSGEARIELRPGPGGIRIVGGDS